MTVHKSPNKEIVDAIEKTLRKNGGYCPCRIEQTPDTKCMCKEFRDQIADENFHGPCHCSLYIKE